MSPVVDVPVQSNPVADLDSAVCNAAKKLADGYLVENLPAYCRAVRDLAQAMVLLSSLEPVPDAPSAQES